MRKLTGIALFVLVVLSACVSSGIPAAQSAAAAQTKKTAGTEKIGPASLPAEIDPAPWFFDDFESGSADNWELWPGNNAALTVVTEPGTSNKVLQHKAAGLPFMPVMIMKDEVWAQVAADHGKDACGNYFIEARIKPQQNGTTANKFLFLLARYKNADNWAFGGLNVQNSAPSSQVEAGKMMKGNIDRALKQKRPIELGQQGDPDGCWYTVRLECLDDTYTVYLDGERVGSISDTTFGSGKVAVYTYNRSFYMDDILIGDPRLKPARLKVEPGRSVLGIEAGDSKNFSVTAIKTDGQSADTVSVSSSLPDVAKATLGSDGKTVTVQALAPGEALVSLTSESGLRKNITVQVREPYRDVSVVYPGLGQAVYPAPGATVPADTSLVLNFDSPVKRGPGGTMYVFDADGNDVDQIEFSEEKDRIGPDGGALRELNVGNGKIQMEGSLVHVSLHHGRLQPGQTYSVGIPAGTFDGNLRGKKFAGIGTAAGWSFTVADKIGPARLPAAGADAVLVVDASGKGDFASLQGALDYSMAKLGRDRPVKIRLKTGVYYEPLFLKGKNNVSIIGEGPEKSRVIYENYDALNGGTSGRPLFLVKNCDNLRLENFSITNTHQRSGEGDQAETIYFNSPQGKLTAVNMRFSSEQDTLNLKGYNWFYQCIVEGNVDFIWGSSNICLFEECEIRSLGDSKIKGGASGGYIMQARTPHGVPGYVFLNCTLTYAEGPTGTKVMTGQTFLGRSGGKDSYFDNIAYINCKMDTHISEVGWHRSPSPNPKQASATDGWKEYGSMDMNGNPLDVNKRYSGAYLLGESEYKTMYSHRNFIFEGSGWNPEP